MKQEDVREGITAGFQSDTNPQYEGQTKTKLGNSEVRRIVSEFSVNNLKDFYMKIRQLPVRLWRKHTASRAQSCSSKEEKLLEERIH